MKIFGRIFRIAVLLNVVSCATPSGKQIERQEPFRSVFTRFTSALQNHDTAAFRSFISPEHGLYLIESTGALPQITRVVDVGSFKHIAGSLSFFETVPPALPCELTEGKLPEVDCDNPPEFYSESGCFSAPVNLLNSEHPWDYIEMGASQRQNILRAASEVTRTVIITAGRRYFFAQPRVLGGHWVVLFIDMRSRCSA